ncbi:hypothetical protein RF371_11495 [Companilactobacillus paralimentarius]|uniref:hypothetical protein n=1 Tax=Companilactobacillus paralimentarius TaxID=83526 RepID=UPI00285316C2|nr:hypothetical protein [Companilactobacillus paralimentarius]MDR4934415.1 hypothetical protein [Companilactobacillus paralimentarius]
MADNALTKVARIASKAAQGATYKDAKGNIQIIKPAGDSNYMDFTNFLTSTNGTGGSAGGNTGGNTGGDSGGTTGGNTSTPVSQLPSTVNLFSGSAVGNILLSGPSTNYDNVQDGLLITLSNITPQFIDGNIGGHFNIPANVGAFRIDLSLSGLKGVKIPKEQLIVGNSFDISNQLSQYVGKAVQLQELGSDAHSWIPTDSTYSYSITSFGGTTVKVLPNTALSINLTVNIKENSTNLGFNDNAPIPVIQVNDYKN